MDAFHIQMRKANNDINKDKKILLHTHLEGHIYNCQNVATVQ